MPGSCTNEIVCSPHARPEFRDPAWRWHYASQRAAGSRKRGQYEDIWIYRCLHYLLKTKKAKCIDVPESVMIEYPDIFYAQRINEDAEGPQLRAQVEALIIANEDADEIAAVCHLSNSDCVEAYEALYYDVRESIVGGTFPRWKVLNMTSPDTIREENHFLKYLALAFGGEAVKMAVRTGPIPEEDFADFTAQIYNRQSAEGAMRAVCGLNPRFTPHAEILLNNYNNIANRQSMEGAVNMVAAQTTTAIEGMKADSMFQLSVCPPEGVSLPEIELRTAEILHKIDATVKENK